MSTYPFPIPSLRRGSDTPVDMASFGEHAGRTVGTVADVEKVLFTIEPALVALTLLGYEARYCVVRTPPPSVATGPPTPEVSNVTALAIDLGSWWVRHPSTVGWDLDGTQHDDPIDTLGTQYISIFVSERSGFAPNVPGLVSVDSAVYPVDRTVDVRTSTLSPVDPTVVDATRWISIDLPDTAGLGFDAELAVAVADVSRSWLDLLAVAPADAGLLGLLDPAMIGFPGPLAPDADGFGPALARVHAVFVAAAATPARNEWLRGEIGLAAPTEPQSTTGRVGGPSAWDRLVAGSDGDVDGARRDAEAILTLAGAQPLQGIFDPPSVFQANGFQPVLTLDDLERRSWITMLMTLHLCLEIDVLSTLLPRPIELTGPTVDDALNQLHRDIDPAGRLTQEQWSAVLIAMLKDISIALPVLVRALNCARPLSMVDLGLILRALGEAANNVPVTLPSSCDLRRFVKFANCLMREGFFMEVAPDVFDAWIDGTAAVSGALPSETIALPPDSRGVPTPVVYQPIPAAYAVERHIDGIGFAIFLESVSSFWAGVIARVRQPNETFPVYSDPLNPPPMLANQVIVGQGPSTLHQGAVEYIYPASARVSYVAPLIGASAAPEIVDYDLYPLRGMAVVSEVEVTAVLATQAINGNDVDGMIVTVQRWRVRVWDTFDFNVADVFRVRTPDHTVEIDDDSMRRLQTSPCPGHPLPADLVTMTERWVELDWTPFCASSAFVSLNTVSIESGGVFDTTVQQIDRFVPGSDTPLVDPTMTFVPTPMDIGMRTEPLVTP